MSDKQVYTAYILDKTDLGIQLLKVAFEYKILEFWGEKEAQEELIGYFKEAHYSHDTPIIVEASDLFGIMPYRPTTEERTV